ncbi:stage V sporulation protein B [Baia soyae]|uniref:Stage V sporulation protein B n=1 Tax=Baia soyae TaxID=1544746 RepID=A0A4R2S2Z4_9BACL|nr:stage V sporulation protein B [Baia soyae]TCP65665.1 stage V sporulation protein B [Baia soyae]
MRKQSFLAGTLILVGAGFLTKILGFIYRIALSRLIGDEGMGLFQLAFPILIFAVVITSAGIPVAISKLVSEAEAKNEEHKIPHIIIVAGIVVGITSTIVTSLVFVFAPILAKTLLTDPRTLYALMGITPIIPVIAISSIFRGYFQGRQNMSPYALSQIIEQVVRIFTVLMLAKYLLPYGVEYAASGAMIGMVIGEFTGMLYLYYRYRKDPKRPILRQIWKRRKNQKDDKNIVSRFNTITDFFRVAVPVTLSRTIGSLTYAVEPIIVSQSLAIAGIAAATSTALYGQLEGMALPLVFFPAFITYALTVSLVPAVSEAAAQHNTTLIERRLQQAIRLSLIIGAPCTMLVYVLAEPLATLLYHQPSVGQMIQIMAPISLFHYLQGPFAAVLQGLDKANIAMRNSIIGAVIKIVCIWLLATRPSLGIMGVAIAINIGILVVTCLHFISIIKLVPYMINARELVKLTISIGGMGFVCYYLGTQAHSPLLQRVLLTILCGFGIYLICLVLFSLIRKDDVSRLPYVGAWVARFLPR